MKALPIILAVLVVLTSLVAWWPDQQVVSQNAGPRFFGPVIPKGDEAAFVRSVKNMEIQRYDEQAATLSTFAVSEGEDGWVIPSHHNYPADGGARVGEAAGSVLGVDRGQLVTEDPARHGQLGVLDPDPSKDSAGPGDERGTRVTLKGAQDQVILDIIVGGYVEANVEQRYVREYGSNQVYRTDLSPNLSSRFVDYVERDLLKINRADIRRVVIDPHRVDEIQQQVLQAPKVTMRKGAGADTWTSPDQPEGQMIDEEKVKGILDAIGQVRLQGVRPLQPPSLERLVRFGFFTRDGSQFWGNEGALEIHLGSGLAYVLYFGEVAPSEGLALTAGTADGDLPEGSVAGDNRYFLVFVAYDESTDEELKAELDKAEAEARAGLADGETLGAEAQATLDETLAKLRTERVAAMVAERDETQARFLQFFFVMGADVFEQLHPRPDELFVAAPVEAPAPSTPEAQPVPPAVDAPPAGN